MHLTLQHDVCIAVALPMNQPIFGRYLHLLGILWQVTRFKLHMQVTPVIGRLMTTEALTPNPSEVNAVFDMPLAAFLEDVPSHTYKDAEWQGIKYRLHYFEYNNFLVWGLTAAMLIQVAQHAFARPTDFLELTPGSRPYHQLFFNGERLLWREPRTS